MSLLLSNARGFTITPINGYVLVLKDEDRKTTAGGIALPDNLSIPTWTARVLAIAKGVDAEYNVMSKVIVDPRSSIPVDAESGKHFLVRADAIVAYYEKDSSGAKSNANSV